MLIEFSVGNYLSFKETVTLSMVATNVIAKNKSVDENNVFDVDEELSLLKSVAVYGANASGKSNLIQAMNFMRWFVLNSSKETQLGDAINVEEFKLSTETEREPSFFEIVFILEEKLYRYGFEVDEKKVVSEWLFYVPKVRESKLFERDENGIKMTKVFKEGELISDKTRNNALFLSVNAQFNGKISTNIFRWFMDLNIISGLHSDFYQQVTVEYLQDSEYENEIIQLIRKWDLGIDNIKIVPKNVLLEELQELPGFTEEFRKRMLEAGVQINQIQIKTLHKKYDYEGEMVSQVVFDFQENESEGTKKLFAFAVPILDSLRYGDILIIDELDARLHPIITRAIIELFNSNQTNPENAQLIFTTHDTNLLSNKIFRRDQIWFTEKNRQGATDLYSLVEYKVRNDASFESDYIKGRYGAIPFLGDLTELFEKNG
ncbi:abortive infection protein [Hydrocoleum sp. CS-953]|uniref:AAA family ATPase n=1 Tax=Hydrocoleum sp. CS-953 TaxID=1671698 RepID=UPI000B9AA4E7|nr:ATP-binding protein [Hydrocoleum sp. CS-953]OZH51795.1 abortive infection protein [Hydrocoleum sp. CS-953]